MKHSHLRLVWGAFALLALVFILAPVVLALEVFKSEGRDGQPMSLTLLETRCGDAAILKHLLTRVNAATLEKFKDARLFYGGKEYASCWVEWDGVVFSIDDTGETLQPIPRSSFKDGAV